MTRQKVVIGYSPSQGQRRTTFVPTHRSLDQHDEVSVPGHVTTCQTMGEAVLVVSLADYQLRGPDTLLAAYLGRPPTSDRHALINAAGFVVGIVRADPQLDFKAFLPHRLHPDPRGKAVVGSLAPALDAP